MADPINDGGPAFPRSAVANDYGIAYGEQDGMTLRDWFAGQIIAGWSANPNVIVRPGSSLSAAYELADAMLAARKGSDA